MKNSEILKKAKEVISNKNNWCQEILCADDNYNGVDIEKATKFCAYGALSKVLNNSKPVIYNIFVNYLRDASNELFNTTVVSLVNDSPKYGHKCILEIYDKAIELAKKDEIEV